MSVKISVRIKSGRTFLMKVRGWKKLIKKDPNIIIDQNNVYLIIIFYKQISYNF